MVGSQIRAVPVDHSLLETSLEFLGLAFEHGGLIGHSNAFQMFVGFKSF